MGGIRYSKYSGDFWESLSLEELLDKLADFLLSSGFRNWYDSYHYGYDEHTLESLHNAILHALIEGGMLPDELIQKLLGEDQKYDGSDLEKLVNNLVQRLVEEGYISVIPPNQHFPGEGFQGRYEQDSKIGNTRFQITDKTLDFLGYRTLKDLLGSLGKSSFGRHDTREMASGIETSGAAKQYEFGYTFNLNISETLLNAVKREGVGVPINVEYQDLMVDQCEYQSSCATVLMLDTSHSMILYGEDRFTPAKRVTLALSHLIKTQYPGDSLNLVLFHDSAEELPLSQLARVRVGPFYTNTCEGLKLAQRILSRQTKDMKQIIMITDGKPSAITEDDGNIYKNPFGLDPLIVKRTFEEVTNCRKSGILINTFMLARNYDLVDFVKKVTEICRGKAYFTTPYSLGQFLLIDFMSNKTRKIH